MADSTDIDALLLQIQEEAILESVPQISPKNAGVLAGYLQRSGAKTLLEIGTAHGYSSIFFAHALPELSITTLEHSQIAWIRALENIDGAGFSHRIASHQTRAQEYLQSHADESYDAVFIDGIKKSTLEFFLLTRPLRPRLTLIDDVVKFRHKMEDFYTYLERDNIPYRIEMTDPDDGIMIIES